MREVDRLWWFYLGSCTSKPSGGIHRWLDAGALNHVDYTELYRAGKDDEMLLKFKLPEVLRFGYLLTYLDK